MELRVMVNFLKIAELENISRAAEELHIAQPHLTRQLQNLEQELGVTLFIREKKRLHITEEGVFLRQQIEQILSLVGKTTAQISEMGNGISGTLYIGSIETVGPLFLPEWIGGFKKLYPNVRYDLWSGNSKDVTERLEKGLLDVALIRGPYDESKYHGIRVSDEEWIALMYEGDSLASKEGTAITLKDLEDRELMVPAQRIGEMKAWFTEKGLRSNITCGFSPLMNAVIMAECNLGIAILPESARYLARHHKTVIRRLEQPHYSTVSLIWRKNSNETGAAKRFLEYIGGIIRSAV